LDEFTDEIEGWIIDELKKIGCDTARSVLNKPAEEISRRADLEMETVQDIRRILKAEFDNE
jgi:N utilization substance protein A